MTRAAYTTMGEVLGPNTRKISARFLCTGSAMVLLLRNIDTDTIHLIRRWRSDIILLYPHFTSCPVIKVHETTMVAVGNYTLIPAVSPVSETY